MLTPTLKNILTSADIKTQLQIARQFIPSKKELKSAEGFTDDPMGEQGISGDHAREFIHKYPDKILIISSDRCPVLCRFCTRKRITYKENGDAQHQDQIHIERIVRYIRDHKEIQEVIFSGGDPFMLTNGKIKDLIDTFIIISQIKKIRFHSRALTILPERFNDDLFNIFQEALGLYPGKQFTFVLHINHPEEITKAALSVVDRFKGIGISLLSQTVLLKNVNDNAALLRLLFEKLVRHGIRPYYIHQLDKITGSSHFEVNMEQGIELIKNLRSTLPRCMIPAYVMDGAEGKKRII